MIYNILFHQQNFNADLFIKNNIHNTIIKKQINLITSLKIKLSQFMRKYKTMDLQFQIVINIPIVARAQFDITPKQHNWLVKSKFSEQ